MKFERIVLCMQHCIQMLTVRLMSRRALVHELSTVDLWRDIRCFLICLPSALNDPSIVERLIDHLRERFPTSKLSFYLPPDSTASGVVADSNLIAATRADLNFLGIPMAGLRARIEGLQADVVIDLATQWDPLTGFICLKSGARLKVGFMKAHGDLVYNYQIAPRPESGMRERYDVMARYLG